MELDQGCFLLPAAEQRGGYPRCLMSNWKVGSQWMRDRCAESGSCPSLWTDGDLKKWAGQPGHGGHLWLILFQRITRNPWLGSLLAGRGKAGCGSHPNPGIKNTLCCLNLPHYEKPGPCPGWIANWCQRLTSKS